MYHDVFLLYIFNYDLFSNSYVGYGRNTTEARVLQTTSRKIGSENLEESKGFIFV